MTKLIHVKKRDGSIENFEEGKIIRVVKATGLTQEEGQKLAKEISRWIDSFPRSIITSFEIKNKLLEELKQVNAYAADLYEWYQNIKEKENQHE